MPDAVSLLSSAGAVPFPSDNPDAWDTVILTGNASGVKTKVTLPGICSVEVNDGDDLDIQKKKGGQGATIVYHGKNPAKIKVKVLIHDASQMPDLVKALATLRKLRANPQPIVMTHPQATLHDIKAVAIENVVSKAPPEGGDRLETEIDLVEFFPATGSKKAVSKAYAATGAIGGPIDQPWLPKATPKPSASGASKP